MRSVSKWDNVAGFLLHAVVWIALSYAICESLLALTGYRPRVFIWLTAAWIIVRDAASRFGGRR